MTEIRNAIESAHIALYDQHRSTLRLGGTAAGSDTCQAEVRHRPVERERVSTLSWGDGRNAGCARWSVTRFALGHQLYRGDLGEMAIDFPVSVDDAEDDLHRHVQRCEAGCGDESHLPTVVRTNLCPVGLELRSAYVSAILEEAG